MINLALCVAVLDQPGADAQSFSPLCACLMAHVQVFSETSTLPDFLGFGLWGVELCGLFHSERIHGYGPKKDKTRGEIRPVNLIK